MSMRINQKKINNLIREICDAGWPEIFIVHLKI